MMWLALTMVLAVDVDSVFDRVAIDANQPTYRALELTRAQINLALDVSEREKKHPRLVRMQAEVDALRAIVKPDLGIVDKYQTRGMVNAIIAQVKADLAKSERLFKDDHPRLAVLKQQQIQLEKLLDEPHTTP